MDSLWPHLRQDLKETLSADQFSRWIEPLRATCVQSGELFLEAPTRFHYDWIREHHLRLIQSRCRKLNSSAEVCLQLPGRRSGASRRLQSSSGTLPLMINSPSLQTFQNYLVAPFNRLAFAAAQQICEYRSSTYNPLFIEGPAGLGKTHLLHAIRNAWVAKDEETAYLDCGKLPGAGRALDAVLHEDLWRFLAAVDLLLVDNVHLMPTAGNFQQHFREIFDRFYDLEKQMVFAANRSPHRISELISDLRSRLGWGLTARIREIDLESCQQLVHAMLGDTVAAFTMDVFHQIIEPVPSSFQKIKDCVEKLQEIVKKEGSIADFQETAQCIASRKNTDRESLSIEAIQKVICANYGVSMEALRGATKARPVVIARQMGMYLSRKLTDSTYASIGAAFGGRDHSTVISACRKVRAEKRRTQAFAARILDIERKIL